MRTLRMVVFIGAALGAMAPTASAAPADEVSQARAHFESASRHFDLAEYEQALVEFKEAYRIKPDAAFLFNIAQCHRRLGHVEDAITFYRTYLRRSPEAPNRDEVERRLQELDAERKTQESKNAAQAVQRDTPSFPSISYRSTPNPRGTDRRDNPFESLPGDAVAASGTRGAEPPGVDVRAGAAPAGTEVKETPVYARWWFWTGIGAVVVTGVTTAILLSRSGGTASFCPDCVDTSRVRTK